MTADSKPFAALVSEAVAVERERLVLASTAGRKLTPAAFVREAMEAAGTDSERLAALREAVEKAGGGSIRDTPGALRRMIRAVRTSNYPSPPKTVRTLRHMLTPDATGELAKLNATALDLFALAAFIAAERYPEDFGTGESSDAVAGRLLELTVKRDQLYARIAEEFTPNDLLLSDWDAQGKCRAGFAMTKGAVSIVPREDCAQRLVNWALANPKTPLGP